MCHVYAKERGLAAYTGLSITRDVRGGGCEMCTPPPSAQLALRSGSSKLDCMGLKIDPFRNRWAYIAVFGHILKWKSHAIALQKDILTFIARIFVNQ